MPARSKAQFRFMEAAAHSPGFAEKVGIKPSQAEEYTEGQKNYKDLPERKALDKATLQLSRMLKDFGSAPVSGALQSGSVFTPVGGSGRKPKGYKDPVRRGSAAEAEKN